MTTTQPLLNLHRLRLLVVLWVFLASLYTITYSGAIESGDSHRLFDAVSSLVDYGDQFIDLAAWQFPTRQFVNPGSYWELPLETANVEPMQIIAAAPLYWLAKLVPNIGLVHTTYLFNVLVGATIGGVLYLYVLALGYDERTAALATIVFGVGSALVPYTKTFFREPLMMLCLLVTALAIERVRVSGYRSWLWFGVGLVALLALALTKVSSLLAMPALLVIALPALRGINRRLVIALGVAGLLLALVFIALGVFNLVPGLNIRYDVLQQLAGASSQYLGVALHSYLFSVGGSIWGTSPVLLLALPGVVLLLRRRQFRYPLAIALLLLAFAFGYALLNDAHWFGGLSWPPRFLLPVLAVVFIGALPALDWLARHPRTLGGILALLLLGYSIWVQISGVSLAWGDYADALPAEAQGFLEWGGGLNLVVYLRWVIIPSLWAVRPLDNAWSLIEVPFVPALLGTLALMCLVWVWRNLASPPDPLSMSWRGGADRAGVKPRKILSAPVILMLLYLLMTYAGLRLLYERDGRYFAADQPLHEMLSVIDAETTRDDVLLLSTPRYEIFFLNYYKSFDSARVITLPPQPGEQPSPEQQPRVRSDNPAALLTNETAPIIHTLANTHERLWLLVQFGPDYPWSTRPVERFMSGHYYPVDYQPTAPDVRLVEYSTISAPDTFAFRGAEQPTDLVFGDSIRLAGFTMPAGTEYAAGDVLPVSLYWRTDEPLEAIYTVALYLGQPGMPVFTQSDWQPAGNFAPTNTWQAGAPVWDHRALQLPPDLAPGDYQLWVKVYENPGGSAPQDLPVTGAETIEGVIGVLPLPITITAR